LLKKKNCEPRIYIQLINFYLKIREKKRTSQYIRSQKIYHRKTLFKRNLEECNIVRRKINIGRTNKINQVSVG
jgi:hypothetical protein